MLKSIGSERMNDHIEPIIYMSILCLVFTIDWIWKVNDKKRIRKYIEAFGGEVESIQKISMHNHIYSVSYHHNGEKNSKTVRYTFTQGEIWF